MNTALAAAFCLLAAQSATAQALPAANAAAELSRAMRMDEFLANRWNSAAVKVHQMNKSTPDRLACAASAFKTEEFTAKAPQLLEALLSPDELSQALKFYDSELGQRWVAYTFDVFHAQDTGEARKVKLGRKEMKSVEEFMATPVGARVANMANVSSSEVARNTFGNVVIDAIRRCPAPRK